ncbi:expressed unknown protein [Ectocarpus siliculosus]|uniref:V-type proton ATPase subunit S1/VOA1 transmembrane domain-containing protein n=1 Tax=Ectocarpus siliculosus TaxID=2880 RepID=D8LJ92_ECTSI|nr:expressed unknown protein [Ectocarpus siliculosus]|eukprot:CBN76976.1 expressed unknown protein [Ectocarpus siliculosus]
MRRPASRTLVAGLCAAASSVSYAGRALDAGAWEVVRGGQECHRSFPAFLWAGSNTGGNLEEGYHHAATDAFEVAEIVVDAAASAKEMEVVVVVLSQGSSFSTSGVSDANAAARSADGGSPLHAKSASATFPYTYPSPTTLRNALPLLAGELEVPVHTLPLEEVVPASASLGLLDDGKLDLIIVTVPEAATIEETDATVRTVTSSLEEKSVGRFIFLWTGDFHDEACGRRSLKAESRAHRRLATESLTRTIKITPDILAGLLTLLLFLFILVTGLGCVGDIECPKSFSSEDPAKGREY